MGALPGDSIHIGVEPGGEARMSARTDIQVWPGDVLAGKHSVALVQGQGGTGCVLAVRHLLLDERRALKVMLPDSLGGPQANERFFREARAAARIRSDHVTKVQRRDESNEPDPCDDTTNLCRTAARVDLRAQARLFGDVSTAAFVIGGLVGAAGIVMLAIPIGRAPVRAAVSPSFIGAEGSF